MKPQAKVPNWLRQNLVDQCVQGHWNNTGRYLFVHVWGISYRNQNDNAVFKKLKTLLHKVLNKFLLEESEQATQWIQTLRYKEDFIALIHWLQVKQINFMDIAEKNRSRLCNQLLLQWKNETARIPEHLASDNYSTPFSLYQLSDLKYQNTFPYLLLLLLFTTKEEQKIFQNICYEVKPLFYGSYRAVTIAKSFTKTFLITVLSGYKIVGWNEQMMANLQRFLTIVGETLLFPYVHISERVDEIWNPQTENIGLSFSYGSQLVNHALKQIQDHEVKDLYQPFMALFHQCKRAQWPFEREKKEEAEKPAYQNKFTKKNRFSNL